MEIAENDGFVVVKTKATKRNAAEVEGNDCEQMDIVEPQTKKLHLSTEANGPVKRQLRKVRVPRNRMTALRENWDRIQPPIVENLRLNIRFNVTTKFVELMSSEYTTDIGNLQKAADFVRAFLLGFRVEDALVLLRLDDMYVDSFDITDVKPLKGHHLSRAIGRVAGKGGMTKFSIENATKTRIVLQNTKVHILGSYQDCRIAKRRISDLVMGAKATTVYGRLKGDSRRSANF